MKRKMWLILVPMIILVITTFVFLFTKEKVIRCGDGKCDADEVGKCFYDCTSECATRGIEPKDYCITRGIEPTQEGDCELCSTGWQTSYQLQMAENNIQKEYLKETEIYDFSDLSIQLLANQLKRDTAKETAKVIFKWTFENLDYDNDNNYFDCKGVKASEVLKRRYGICSTMTKMNIALLRANGIAAYSRSGCFQFSESCRLVQTFFRKPLPIFVEVKKDEDTEYYSTRGGLHNWVVMWLPEEGWVRGESTAGVIYDDTCINYYDYNETAEDAISCGFNPNIEKQNEFIEFCKGLR